MKKIITLFIIAISVFFLNGCTKKFLDTQPLNALSNGTFWKSENDANMAIMGCYDALQQLYGGGPWGIGYIQTEGMTDNAYFNWGNGLDDLDQARATPSNGQVTGWWGANYLGIVRANNVLAYVPAIKMDSSAKNSILGEAKFIRAAFYLNLAMTFQNVPLILEPQTLATANVPKNTRDEVFTQIIKDFQDAANELPKERTSSESGRATQGAALGMLTRTYLYDNMWPEAANTAKEIMDNFDYSLNPNYQQLFTLSGETSKEILFAVDFERGVKEGELVGRWIGVPPPFIAPLPDLVNAYYCTDGKPINVSPLFKGDLSWTPNLNDLDYLKDTLQYENRDPRLDMTIVRNGGMWLGKPIVTYYTLDYLHFRKWAEESNADMNDGAQNFYIIRYADILLMRAEALVMSGNYNESEVDNLIDQIRQRPSVMMPKVEEMEGTGLSKDSLMSIIKHERRIEFAYEGTRYYDLERWGELKKVYENVWAPLPRVYLDPSSSIWPIPQSEIDVNSKLEQNKEWQ